MFGKRQREALHREVAKLHREKAADLALYLQILRRELANHLIREDADRFLKLYESAREAEMEIGAMDKEAQEVSLQQIVQKFPNFQEFDIIQTREHVIYEDALNWHQIEDIETHYLNIVKYHALMRILDTDWQHVLTATDEGDLEHLRGYVARIKDTKFKQRVLAAVREYQEVKWSGYDTREITSQPSYEPGATALYETGAFAIFALPNSMSVGRSYSLYFYGLWLKDVDEYAIYEMGRLDDREPPTAYTYVERSDQRFETRENIDELRLDRPL